MSKTIRRQTGNRAWTQIKYWKFTNEREGIDREWVALMQRDCLSNKNRCGNFKQYVKERRRSLQQKELARIKKLDYHDQHYIDSLDHDKGWWILW